MQMDGFLLLYRSRRETACEYDGCALLSFRSIEATHVWHETAKSQGPRSSESVASDRLQVFDIEQQNRCRHCNLAETWLTKLGEGLMPRLAQRGGVESTPKWARGAEGQWVPLESAVPNRRKLTSHAQIAHLPGA
jgi:hypothetical protein